MASSAPAEAISLQWVLGANSTAVYALNPSQAGGQRIAYISGNVGVIYDTHAKTQTLLRGHRNPLKSAAVDEQKRIIATACAGSQSSIIFWDATNGVPIGMIESPHAGGTTALAFTPDGRYLSTVSVPSSGEQGEAGVQEVAVWDCACVLAAVGHSPEGWLPQDDDSPRLCSSAVVPTHDEQRHIAISIQPPPAAIAVGRAEAMRDGATIASSWEMVTTGVHSVVFWAVTRCTVRDPHAAGMSTTKLKATGTTRTGASQYATKDVWAIACDVPKVPRGPAAGHMGGRSLSQSAFVPGERADHLSTIDPSVAESKVAAEQEAMNASSSSLRSPSRGGRSPSRGGVRTLGSTATSPSRRGLQDPLGTVMLQPPTTARVSSITGTSEGMVLLWQSDYSVGEVESALGRGMKAGPGSGVASAAAVVVRRTCLKAVKLTAPEFVNLSAAPETGAPAATVTSRINAIRVTPNGQRVVVGTEDGAIRCYDLNMRLLGWFEDLAAGPVSALDFVPGTTAQELAAAGQLPQPGLPPKKALGDVPDVVLATRRCMMLGLQTAAFDTHNPQDESRRGTVLLEGPDAPVTGLAAYPHMPRLAVAVASGVLQVWDTESKALLVLRELTQPPDLDAIAAGKPSPLLYYHPTALAVDPLARFVAVGTAEGFILILNPEDLSDVQTAVPPPEYPRAGHPVTRLAFSPDGYHLAAADAARHVALYRFARQTTRRLTQGMAQTTAVDRLASRKPWETVIPEADRFEEVVVDSWIYVGRVRGHKQAVTGLAFSQLPPGVQQLPAGCGASAVPGLDRPAFWAADTTDDAEVASRHIQHGLAQLASVGADRRMCLYDVGGASVTGGVPVRSSRSNVKIDVSARPTAAIWLPPRASCPALSEDYGATASGCSLVVPSDDYKIKVWDVAGSPAPARTVLAPTFGGAISHAALLPSRATPAGTAGESKADELSGKARGAPYALAYATDDRIVGIARLPLDGSPYGYVGVVGHTGPVAAMAASSDGSQVFTAGVDSANAGASSSATTPGSPGFSVDALLSAGSGSVCIWTVNEDAVHAAAAEGGTGIQPFLTLLEGGASGQQYSDICDLFSYAQIRAQGESSTAPRKSGVDLPVTELSAVMRGLGYFLTAEAAEAMVSEARASMGELRAAAGEAPATGGAETVDLQTLIRLYVNHRPVRSLTAQDVHSALAVIANSVEAQGETDSNGVRWGGLARILGSHAEKLSAEELNACVLGLLGTDSSGGMSAAAQAAAQGVPLLDDDDVLSSEDVASKILGMV